MPAQGVDMAVMGRRGFLVGAAATGLGPAFAADELRLGSRQVARLRFDDSPEAAGNGLLFVIVEGMAHEYPSLMPGALWEFFGMHTL